MNTVTRTIWILSALAILGMTVLFGAMPPPAPIPEAMKRFTTSDRSIRIDHPGNWKSRVRSSHGIETELQFKPAHNVFMTIDVNLQGSLMVDMLKSVDSQNSQIASMIPGGAALNTNRLTPMEHLHEMQASQMKNSVAEYPGFADGTTEKTQIGGKQAIVTTCTWTSPGLLGSKPMVGRRVTLLSGDHHVSAQYGCPKAMQQSVLPVFDKMLNSMEIDVQGGAQ